MGTCSILESWESKCRLCGCTCAVAPCSFLFPGRHPVALSYHDNGKPHEITERNATDLNQVYMGAINLFLILFGI